jgi:type I restriction enzyme M protein
MFTGDLKNKIDQIWNAFWSGGIANPIEVIEQITYLLFLRRLDDLHTPGRKQSYALKSPDGAPHIPRRQRLARSRFRKPALEPL